MSGNEWMDQSACLEHPPAWFDSYDLGDASGKQLNDAAVQICRSCPVRMRCLEDALDRGEWGVVRGGYVLRTPKRLGRCGRCGRSCPVDRRTKYCSTACNLAAKVEQARRAA